MSESVAVVVEEERSCLDWRQHFLCHCTNAPSIMELLSISTGACELTENLPHQCRARFPCVGTKLERKPCVAPRPNGRSRHASALLD